MRNYDDLLLARYARNRRPRDFAALFDRTAPRLLRRARQIDPRRAGALVQATLEAVLFGTVRFDPKRRCFPFLLDILLRKAGFPRPGSDPSTTTGCAAGRPDLTRRGLAVARG